MITPKTILLFLIGQRNAIEKIASTKLSLLLALFFIISAGLARNYDHHLLAREPLWIGGPVFMTLFSSLFIFAFLKLFAGPRLPKFTGKNYLAFLSCFAMTAPLAWLYGFPIERFASPLLSAKFNFAVLILVSLWRLILMARVISVLFNYHPIHGFVLITIPASLEMCIGSIQKQFSIVGIMGGMRLSPADEFLSLASSIVTLTSIVLFLTCLFGLVFCPEKTPIPWVARSQKTTITKVTWITSITVIALWLMMAITPQKQLTTRHQFRQLISRDDYQEATTFLQPLTRANFPIHQEILNSRTYNWCHPAIEPLALHDDWPQWLREEWHQDLKAWFKLGDKDHEISDAQITFLYQSLHDAPYIQKLADVITPGVIVKDLAPLVSPKESNLPESPNPE